MNNNTYYDDRLIAIYQDSLIEQINICCLLRVLCKQDFLS